jgi:hypothetical protein
MLHDLQPGTASYSRSTKKNPTESDTVVDLGGEFRRRNLLNGATCIETIRNDGGEYTHYIKLRPPPGGAQQISCLFLETPIGFLVPHQVNFLRSVADPLRKGWALHGPGIADPTP